MKRIEISASKKYAVTVGNGLLASAGEWLSEIHPKCRVMLVSDRTVFSLYGFAVRDSLEKAGYTVKSFVFPAGEASKSLSTLGELLEAMAEAEITRADLVAALGGGVPGDLAGFTASVYLRGIDFVQLPTTLLAAVDSSVGGKTAVDLAHGKNLAGTFYQPSGVLCDCDTFKTLSDATLADGMAEVLKYGILCDSGLFSRLEKGGAADEDTVARCVEIKRGYVEADEHDRGERAFLNLGHTFAHAIERASDYGVSHGRAVGIGLAMASRLSAALGLGSQEAAARTEAALEANGLEAHTALDARALAAASALDKKRAGDTVKLILPEKIGKCVIYPVTVSGLEKLFIAGI